MAPTIGSSLKRWTDEERNMLTHISNAQITKEKKDSSQIISWKLLFEIISQAMAKEGYSRTDNACRKYWTTKATEQRELEQAAGPYWELKEHRLLFSALGEQELLSPGEPDWDEVTEYLKPHAVERSVEQCYAYWKLAKLESQFTLVLPSDWMPARLIDRTNTARYKSADESDDSASEASNTFSRPSMQRATRSTSPESINRSKGQSGKQNL